MANGMEMLIIKKQEEGIWKQERKMEKGTKGTDNAKVTHY